MDEAASLDAFLIGDDADLHGDFDMTPVEIDGLTDADRWLRRLGRLARQQREVEEVARAERERISAWEEDRMSGISRAREWAESTLDGFMRAYNAVTGTKTVKLPNGVLSLSKTRDKLLAIEENEAIVWCLEEADEWIKRTAGIRIADIKAATTPGPDVDIERYPDPPAGYRFAAAVVDDGRVVPGVVYLVSDRLSFKATANNDLPPEIDIEEDNP